MSRNIYQELWDLDIQPGNNGCTVTARGPDGQWLNSNADIKLDEQNELSSGSSDDAPNPLIDDFNADKLQGKTYLALKALMNNYVFNARQSEDHLGDNAVEDTAIEIFMDKIQDTPVMQMAFDHTRGEYRCSRIPGSDEEVMVRYLHQIITITIPCLSVQGLSISWLGRVKATPMTEALVDITAGPSTYSTSKAKESTSMASTTAIS